MSRGIKGDVEKKVQRHTFFIRYRTSTCQLESYRTVKPAENKIRDDLTVLRDRCFFYLRKTSEYPTSDIEENDLSFEFASAETIYSIDRFDRALRCLDLRERENEDIEFLRDSLYELIDDSDKDFLVRFRRYCDDYLSPGRFQEMIELVKQNKIDSDRNLSSVTDEETDEMIANDVCEVVSIKDQVSLLKRDQSTFMFYIAELDSSKANRQDWLSYLVELDGSINDIFEENRDLWALFSNDIKLLREMMLVPADEEERWWSLVPDITPKAIMEGMRMRSNTVELLSRTARMNDENRLFENWGELIEETVGGMITDHSEYVNEINVIITRTPNAPQFAHWGSSGIVPSGTSEITFMSKLSIMLREVIDDLIELIEEYPDINEDERKKRLAVAYMIKGDPESAREALAEN